MVQQRKSRILIVEDEEDMALYLRGNLEQLGYDVIGAIATGEEAISRVKECSPELVLMDITLEGKVDGIAATEEIHSFNDVPVVFITGRTDIEQWQRANITEPFGYILKPFELRELDVVIAAAFYKYHKEKEIFATKNRCFDCLGNFGGIVLHCDLDLKPFLVKGPVEQIMGYKPDQILSGQLRIEDIIYPEEGPSYSLEDFQKLKTVPNFGVIRERRMVTRDKQVRWVRESLKNVLNQLGAPATIERVIFDITEQKKSQENLKGLQKQLLHTEKLASIGQLTAGVAHEINNPVGYISNNMEMLRQYVAGYMDVLRIVENLKVSINENNMDKAKSIVQEMSNFEQEIGLDHMMVDSDKLLQHTQRGIDRIQKIVMGLRSFSRSDNEIMELTSVEEILEGVITIVWNEIKYKAEITKEYAKLPLIKCHPQELAQVFVNLMVNAAQAINEKGEIKIRTFHENNHVGVAISDTGSGVLPENMKKIFTPFFTTKERGKGTGLGLSISYDIIKRHGGDILFESQRNIGTTFTVLLPIDGGS